MCRLVWNIKLFWKINNNLSLIRECGDIYGISHVECVLSFYSNETFLIWNRDIKYICPARSQLHLESWITWIVVYEVLCISLEVTNLEDKSIRIVNSIGVNNVGNFYLDRRCWIWSLFIY